MTKTMIIAAIAVKKPNDQEQEVVRVVHVDTRTADLVVDPARVVEAKEADLSVLGRVLSRVRQHLVER